ncbi:zinc finger CCCH domain-containing protein 65-like isoform X3 [Carex rostrata]
MVAPESDTASSSQTEGDVISPPHDDSQDALNEGLCDLKLSEEKSSDGWLGADGEEELDLEPDSLKKGKEGKSVKPRYPVRLEQPDCPFYLRYASCRFGMKCKFNHPHPPKKKKNNKAKPGKSSDADQSDDKGKEVSSEYVEQREPQGVNEEKNKIIIEQKELEAFKGKDKESTSGAFVQECKYFSTPGGCKFGKSCRYLHPEGKPDVPPVELNFLGLPIRPSEKECPYYMRTGSCKYSTYCKFNHPDPTVVALQGENRDNNNKKSNNYGSSKEKAAPTTQAHPPVPVPSVPSWPEQGTALKEPMQYAAAAPPSYAPGIMPPHGIFPNQDWNGYQVPVNPYFVPVQNYQPANVSHASMHHQPPFDEYPERPGQPECQHFVRNGFCKYKHACKFHHPKGHASSNSPGALTSVGLPLNPDQPVCVYYSHWGVCKFGPACRYHHPLNHGPSAAMTGPQSS